MAGAGIHNVKHSFLPYGIVEADFERPLDNLRDHFGSSKRLKKALHCAQPMLQSSYHSIARFVQLLIQTLLFILLGQVHFL